MSNEYIPSEINRLKKTLYAGVVIKLTQWLSSVMSGESHSLTTLQGQVD